METTKPPKLFGSKNLFSIDRLTQKISCFQRYHYFRNPIINGGDIVEIVIRNSYARKRWTWMNGETLSLWIVSWQEKIFSDNLFSFAYLIQKNR